MALTSLSSPGRWSLVLAFQVMRITDLHHCLAVSTFLTGKIKPSVLALVGTTISAEVRSGFWCADWTGLLLLNSGSFCGHFSVGLSFQSLAYFSASSWLVAQEPFQIVSCQLTSCLFIVMEELLSGFCKSQLGVHIIIISGEFSVSLWMTAASDTGL